MPVLTLEFSEALRVFHRRLAGGGPLTVVSPDRAPIKHVIESAGVPHTEVGAIKAGGRPVDFAHVPAADGRVTVASITPPFDPTRPSALRPRPLKALRYLADVNVGKLARLMRMVGVDTEYAADGRDDDIAAKAENEERIVLTKDVGLLKRRRIVYGRFVRAVHPDDQLREVIAFFGLAGRLRPFSRCIRCNAELVPVDKAAVLHRLLPKTRQYFHRFKQCARCRRIYWRGSHHAQMERRARAAGIPI